MKLCLLKSFNERFGIKVFAAFTILIFVISSSFTAFFIQSERKSLRDGLMKNGKLLAGILAYNSRIGVFSENKELLMDPVEGVFQHEQIMEVAVFNLEGKMLERRERPKVTKRETEVEADRRIRHRIFEILGKYGSPFCFEDNGTLEFWASVTSGSTYSTEASLFFEDDFHQKRNRTIGVVCVTVDKFLFDKRLNALLFKGILIGFLFLAIGSTVIYFLVRRFTRPLDRLTEGVKTLEMGGVAENVPVETRDEIGKLATAFNSMSESLKRRDAEKKHLEKQLRHKQKMEAVGTLAGGIAHDFNNILAVIMGYSELALSGIPKGTSLHKKLKGIIKASYRAKDLVGQILTFSRKGEEAQEPVQIGLVVEEALKMLHASLPATIEIRQNLKAGAAVILSDPTQIHQVLMNLCTNAAHAMRDKGGVLEVSLTDAEIDSDSAVRHLNITPGRYQKLTVKDTGHGMAPEIMERIFDPFFTTKGPGEGTGMGLAVVHGIVKRLKGAITVDSRPGKGTTFQLLFPTIENKMENKDAAKPEELASVPHGKNERILFVDDETALVDAVSQMLAGLDYKVAASTKSVEALEAFRSEPTMFDLVITDHTMPDMTGETLAREILRIRPDIPIILCTGFTEAISEKTARAIGIREFVMKPIVRQKMAVIIRRVLDQEVGTEEKESGISLQPFT